MWPLAAAARLLRNVKVADYISERMQERQKRTEVTQDRVIEELAAIAFARATDFAQIVDGCVVLTDTKELSETQNQSHCRNQRRQVWD